MSRYSLRTLIVVMLLGGPALSGLWWLLTVRSRLEKERTLLNSGYVCGVQETYSDEVESAHYAAIVQLVALPSFVDSIADAMPNSHFEVVDVLKGRLKKGQRLSIPYAGKEKPGTRFFLTGWESETPCRKISVADSALQNYVQELSLLPTADDERFEFFLEFLSDDDDPVARDALQELSKAPFTLLEKMRPRLPPDQLREWVQNPNVGASRRGAFFDLLSVCGGKEDLPMLEHWIRHGSQKQRASLDRLLACYVQLGGSEALDGIDECFLTPKDTDYSETFSAVLALRLLSERASTVTEERFLQSFRLLLDRPNMADLIIPDLIRLNDWQSIDRLMTLFRESDGKTSWVRVPVVTYLRSCPLERAKVLLEECYQLDPIETQKSFDCVPSAPTSLGPRL